MIVIELPDEAATAALAARIAALARAGDVIALKGELGAGKTSFARAFIRARGGAGEVPSPTFTLVQVYDVGDAAIWHFDCYRLRRPEEAWELAIEDAFAEGISLIEWPERLGPLVPARRAVAVGPAQRLIRRRRAGRRGPSRSGHSISEIPSLKASSMSSSQASSGSRSR